MVYVARSKDAKQKLQPEQPAPVRSVVLDCGCATDEPSATSNPDRWWCCHAWRARRSAVVQTTPRRGA